MLGFNWAMAIIPYDQFQGRLARERSNGDIVDYELGEDGVYRPVTQLPTQRPTGRPVPRRNPGLGAVGAAVDAVCLARAVAPQGFLRNLVSASPFDVIPGVRNARERAFNYLCGETPNAEVPVESPFSGGQCDAVRYNVSAFGTRQTFTNFQCVDTPYQVNNAQVWGPVAGLRLNPTSPAQWAVQVYCRGRGNQAILPFSQWVVIANISSTQGCDPPTLDGTSISRADGQPDNCGNPNPQVPYGPEPLLPPLTVEIPIGSGNTINTPINVSFDPNVGIEINVGDININFDGENIEYTEPNDDPNEEPIPPLLPPSGNPSPRPGPDDTGTDPENPPPLPPQGIEYEEPEDEPERIIRGVLCTVSQESSELTVIDGAGIDPSNYFPDVGTVKFRCRVEVGSTGFTNPIRVQGLRTFVPCPWDGGAFEVVGTPRPGVAWTLTPVYDVLEPE